MRPIVFAANRGFALRKSREGIITHFLSKGRCVIIATSIDEDSLYLQRLGAVLFEINFNRASLFAFKDIVSFIKIVKLLFLFKVYAVHAFHMKPVLLFGMARYLSLPFNKINLIATITGLGISFDLKGIIFTILKACLRVAFKFYDYMIFQNSDDFEYVVRTFKIPDDKVQLIKGSGVDISLFKSNIMKAHDEKIIIMVGRLIWDKGVNDFVEIAEIVRKWDPDVKFIWAGDTTGDNHPRAVPQSFTSNHSSLVRFVGHVNDVPELLSKSSLFVFPSRYREGLPRVLLEAGAAELPTVAYNVAGVRDIITSDFNGYLVEEGDIKSMADKVITVLSNDQLRRELGLRARVHVEENFNINLIQKKYLSIYSRLDIL